MMDTLYINQLQCQGIIKDPEKLRIQLGFIFIYHMRACNNSNMHMRNPSLYLFYYGVMHVILVA